MGCGGLEGLILREDLLRETEGVVVGSISVLNPQHLDHKKVLSSSASEARAQVERESSES